MAITGDETFADVAITPADTLADEERRRIPAAVASIAAGILTLAGGAITALVFADRPTVHVLDALDEQLQANPPQPGLKARQVLWADEHAVQLVLAGILLALAAVTIGLALSHLYRSVKARRPELRSVILYTAIAGAVLVAVSSLLQAVGSAIAASSFADSANQSAVAARDAIRPPAVLAAGVMQIFGIFALAIGVVALALNGMRVGLLTRFIGVLGFIVGVLFVIPVGAASLPLVQALWFVALGVLFLGRWPGGMPPAWVTGDAQPWPTQQELREARMQRQAETGGTDERPLRRTRRERAEPPETPAPELPERKPHPSSKKRKRKRR